MVDEEGQPAGQGQARSTVWALGIGGTASVAGAFPSFLTGAVAVQLTDDLAFTAAGLGMAVAAFRASAAISVQLLGRLADRMGSATSLRAGVLISAGACLGIATTARSWAMLVGWMALAGLGHAMGQPAVNRLLVRNVRPERQGMAFGLKQSAPPLAAMVAGLSVPLIALTLGWRWTYVLGTVMGVGVVLALGRRPAGPLRARPRRARVRLRNRSAITVLAGSVVLATVASSAVSAFYVDAAVRAGTSPEMAGVVLAAGSLASIITRIACGLISDRMASGHLRLCSALLAAGSLAFGLLATASPGLMGIGAIIALAGTWGFNGVLWYALMRAYPESPGQVTGAMMPPGLIGGTVGPIVFGLMVNLASYPLAWTFAGVASLLSALAMLYGSRRLGANASRTAEAEQAP